MRRIVSLGFSLLLVLGLTFPSAALATAGPDRQTVEVGQHADAESQHGEGHGHRNHLAVFIGATQAELEHGEREDPQFTIGLDYERRLHPIVGVGGLLDVVVEGHREAIIAGAVFLHTHDFTFQIAPGAERARESGHWGFITRFGGMYEFEIDPVTLAPALFYDVTDEGGTWVFGANIGMGF